MRVAALVVSATLLLSSCGREGQSRAVVRVGAPAPAYAAKRLDGAPISLADMRGQVVMVNIWATWCKPCRQEIPALARLFAAHESRGFTIAGVSIDVADDTARIAAFARELGAAYPLWLDPDDRVSMTFAAIGVPATFLIDRRGVLRWKHMGPVRDDDPALLAVLDSALTDTTSAR